MVKRRGAQAGIDGLHPHVLRHTFAHVWLEAGGNEGDLMRLAGWKSRHDAAAVRRVDRRRARPDAHRRIAPGDRL